MKDAGNVKLKLEGKRGSYALFALNTRKKEHYLVKTFKRKDVAIKHARAVKASLIAEGRYCE